MTGRVLRWIMTNIMSMSTFCLLGSSRHVLVCRKKQHRGGIWKQIYENRSLRGIGTFPVGVLSRVSPLFLCILHFQIACPEETHQSDGWLVVVTQLFPFACVSRHALRLHFTLSRWAMLKCFLRLVCLPLTLANQPTQRLLDRLFMSSSCVCPQFISIPTRESKTYLTDATFGLIDSFKNSEPHKKEKKKKWNYKFPFRK